MTGVFESSLYVTTVMILKPQEKNIKRLTRPTNVSENNDTFFHYLIISFSIMIGEAIREPNTLIS